MPLNEGESLIRIDYPCGHKQEGIDTLRRKLTRHCLQCGTPSVQNGAVTVLDGPGSEVAQLPELAENIPTIPAIDFIPDLESDPSPVYEQTEETATKSRKTRRNKS